MPEYTVVHGTFTVDRVYPVPPARVFAAWEDPEALKQWAVPADDWVFELVDFDFRTGGADVARFGPPGAEPFEVEGRFADIVPDTRIVYTHVMRHKGARVSASVTTVEFREVPEGTHMVVTDQGAYFDGRDTPEVREMGVNRQLDNIGAFLGAQPADRKEA